MTVNVYESRGNDMACSIDRLACAVYSPYRLHRVAGYADVGVVPGVSRTVHHSAIFDYKIETHLRYSFHFLQYKISQYCCHGFECGPQMAGARVRVAYRDVVYRVMTW